MYHRLDISPVFYDQWRATAYSKDALGNPVFLKTDFTMFYLLPILLAAPFGLNENVHLSAFDFILKFSILLMPLMLNLFFHILRLKTDQKKPANVNPQSDPAGDLNKNFQAKIDALNQLSVHILYLANACFVSAVLCGVAIAMMSTAATSTGIGWYIGYLTAVAVYALGIHVLLVGLQVLRVTYNLVTHTDENLEE